MSASIQPYFIGVKADEGCDASGHDTSVSHVFNSHNRALRLSLTHTQTANRNQDGTSRAKGELTHIFFGLQILDAVEKDIKAAWQDALIIRGSGHGVRLAG